jgi:AraC-like DNA-binding protein
MTLPEACSFLQDLTQVPAALLSGVRQQALFCATYQFHPVQNYLTPDALESFLAHLSPGRIVHLTDPLGIHFIFTRADQVPLALGPFCTELLTVADCHALFRGLGSLRLPVTDYLAYRSPFPVMEERQVLHLTRCLLKNLGLGREDWEVRDLNCQDHDLPDSDDQEIRRPYSELVTERYAAEQRLMENIRLGNRFAAIANWRDLHNYVAYTRNPKNIGYTIENARTSAAITRTVIRMAAMKAGIPAVLNDKISGESASIIRNASTIEEINREHERLISEYCQIIYDRRTKGYSSLILSAVYHMEHHYSQCITVAALARELDVSPNYLTSRFHAETGLTPTAYLARIRMGQAAWKLANTRLSIHQVSEQVGILDSNYFVKLFKKEFGETPSRYRERMGICFAPGTG